ncbi:hypothetical protein [Vampirovibrio chlorellavorus]|uniref:hypothetical protein n=1 Tax=Vampirovibrio chlorellavorus TaxID=758823 RepID=UPI0026F181CC|nr:hypothetical protein [Vampirovibrio chlorellavorus]
MLKDCFTTRWVGNARIHRVGFSKRAAGLGSTATEMGLIGAVVLVATIGLWFLLGNGLKQALVMVKSDMLAQVSMANASPLGQQEPPSVLPPAALDVLVPEPVEPTPTVMTAGGNGNEAHAEIYKALQELIDRSLKKGTMTEAQADLLRQLVKQMLYSAECAFAAKEAFDAYMKSYGELYELNFYSGPGGGIDQYKLEQVYGEAYKDSNGSYESAEAAYASLLLNTYKPYKPDTGKLYADLAKKYTNTLKSQAVSDKNANINKELDAAVQESGILNDPEVSDFIAQVGQQAFEIFMMGR